MTNTQELLKDVLVDPNDHDPDKQYAYVEDFTEFEGIFAESAEMQSCDITWACSKFMFHRGLNSYANNSCNFCCIAAFWGTLFGIAAYCENFCMRPMGRLSELRRKTPGLSSCFGAWLSCFKELGLACLGFKGEDKTKKKRDSEIKTV
ncbi:uncharacterized protein LOC134254766 [Saccostrea cucullata]|uniref:uncharacterized protein LOC134254766 n=1 Tax=Saccostrea cuccullata TaxID=36930 RepID=UPI002ECFDEE4